MPALQMWLGLLAINVVFGTLAFFGGPSPWWDVAGSVGTEVLVLVFAVAGWRRLWPLLRRTGGHRGAWWRTLVVGALLLAFLETYFALVAQLGLGGFECLEDYRVAGWPLWIGVVLISPWPAVFEELAFRGVIQQRLRAAMGQREARVVQAAMFSVLHFDPLVFVSHFVFGFALGWLRDRTRSLYPGMLLHALWNLRVVWGELDA